MNERVRKEIDFVRIGYLQMEPQNSEVPTDVKGERQVYVSISPKTYDSGFRYTDGQGGSVYKANGFWTAPPKTECKNGMFDGPVSDWDAWKTDQEQSYSAEEMRAIYVRPKEDTIFIRPSLYKDFLSSFVHFCECSKDKKLSAEEKRKFLVEIFRSRYPEFKNVKHLILKIDCLEDIFAYNDIFRPIFIMPKFKQMSKRCAGKSYEEVLYSAAQYLEMLKNPGTVLNRAYLESLFGMFDNSEEFSKVYERLAMAGSEKEFQKYMRGLQRYPEYREQRSNFGINLNFLASILGQIDEQENEEVDGAMTYEYQYFSGLELTLRGCRASKFYGLDEESIRDITYQKDLRIGRRAFEETNLFNPFSSYDIPSLVIFEGDAVTFEKEEEIHYTEEYKRNGYYYDLWEQEVGETVGTEEHKDDSASEKKDDGEVDI